jgi:hypothetical protein
MQWKYNILIYENGTMNPVETILRRRRIKENNGGGESN